MAITETNLDSGADTTNAASYASASITPTANQLVLLTVVNSKGAAPDTPTVTGNGLTWVQIDTQVFNTAATPTRRVTLFRALGVSPSSGAVTIDFAGATQTGCAYSISQFTPVDQGGTNGSGAVVQSAKNSSDSATSLTVTLAAFASTDNATYGGFGNNDTVNPTLGAGFSLVHQTGYVTPSTRIHTQWRATNDTSVDATAASAGTAWGGIAVEIRMAVVGTATLPTLVPEVAFVTNPADPSPTWVNVLADFRAGSTTRGRQKELDRYQAGRMDMVLNNRGRTYDPEYSAGTYAPNVKPMRRTRLRATWVGVTYPIFDGYTDKWDQAYDPPREATATLRATDGFKVLNKSGLPSSAYAAEVAADSPSSWWRLGEPVGSTQLLDAVAAMQAPVVGSPTFGASALPVRESSTAMTFPASGDTMRVELPGTVWPASGSWSLEFWVSGSSSNPNILFDHTFQYGPFNLTIQTLGAGSGLLGCYINVNGVFSSNIFTNTNVMDGSAHHIVIVGVPAAVLKIYKDGAEDWLVNAGTGVVPAAPDQTTYCVNGTTAHSQGGYTIDEVAFYPSALSAARIAAHNTAGRSPWNGDTPGQRVGRILDIARWPAALRNLDTGSTTLQSATLGTTALEHAQKVADSEFGELFMTRDGKVRLIGRTGLLNRTVSATFGDGGGAELGYAAIGFDNGDLLIRNPVTVSRTGGVAQTSSDATGITAYLDHQFTLDGLFHNDDQLSKDAADFFVSEYKDPKSRVTTLVVKPQRDPTNLWPVVLGAELGDVFTVIRRPQGIGAAISQNCEIQGIKHDIKPGEWTVTFTLSPAYTGATPSVPTGAFLQLDLASGPGLDSLRLYF